MILNNRANICYGLPTLAIYYLTRRDPSVWDCLYIVYGLSFFMLPKISPLNFIYGTSILMIHFPCKKNRRKQLSFCNSTKQYLTISIQFVLFVAGFAGAVLFTLLFIYISAFQLSLNEWLLSNTILLPVTSLFMYISYR